MSDLDGSWETVTNTPMGQQKATVTLQTDGDSLSGTMSGAQGTVDIKDGTVDGNTGAWKVSITSPMPMTLEFSATAEGDYQRQRKARRLRQCELHRHPG